MPKAKALIPRKNAKKMKTESPPDSLQSDELDDIPRPSPNGSKYSDNSKRSAQDMEGEPAENDFSGGITNIMERFKGDLNKTLSAKKRKLEQFMTEFVRGTGKRIVENNKNHSTERKKIMEQFQIQIRDLIQQSESEVEKLRDAEDKMQKVLHQQQKQQQVFRIAHSQRLKILKNLSEEFCKGMDDLEVHHVVQCQSVHSELKKEMALLQKKILMDIQQQEMMNVRKHLKSILP